MTRELCVCSWSPCRIYVTSAVQEGGARALPAAWRRPTYVAAKSRGQKSLFIEGQREKEVEMAAVQSRDRGEPYSTISGANFTRCQNTFTSGRHVIVASFPLSQRTLIHCFL